MELITYNSTDGKVVRCSAEPTQDGKFKPVLCTKTHYGTDKDEIGQTFGTYEEAQEYCHNLALLRHPRFVESRI